MAYGLPVKGQANYDDELNNSIEAVKSQAELAQSTADAAQTSAATAATTATNAKATADQALDFVRTTSDDRVAEHVNDTASATSAALSASYAGQHAPDGGASLAVSSTANEDTAFRVVEYRGTLYVGMGWSQGGGNLGGKVYTLNPVTGALTLAYDTGEQSVRSLAVYRGSLYVGTGIGGKVYSYDGTSWALAFTGTAGSSAIAMAVYGGRLYVGETATGKVYSYDGTAWATSFTLPAPTVHIESLSVFEGLLWIGDGTSATAWNVYAYDGTTVGLALTGATANKTEALALAGYRGRLYVSEFDPTGAAGLTEFDPTTGTSRSITVPGAPTAIYSLAVYRDALYLGSHPDGRLYRFDGSAVVQVYQATGMQSLRDLTVVDDRLYVAARASGTPTTGAGVHKYGNAARRPNGDAELPAPVPVARARNERTVGTFDPILPTTDLTIPANRAYYNRVRLHKPTYVSSLRTWVSTASGNVCAGVYAADGAVVAGDVKAPGTRLLTSGSVACPAAGLRSIALTSGRWLLPGDYWFALAADNGTAAFAAQNPTPILADLSQFQDAAFPLPASASGTGGQSGRFYPLWV